MKNWKMWAGYGCMVVGGALSGSGLAGKQLKTAVLGTVITGFGLSLISDHNAEVLESVRDVVIDHEERIRNMEK